MFKKKHSDDLYIRVLNYCRDNIENHISPQKLIFHLNDKYGYSFREVNNHHELEAILKFAFGVDKINDLIAYPMTGEAYFKLLEYEELSLARKNAREARWLSIGAIIIAVIAVAMEFFK